MCARAPPGAPPPPLPPPGVLGLGWGVLGGRKNWKKKNQVCLCADGWMSGRKRKPRTHTRVLFFSWLLLYREKDDLTCGVCFHDDVHFIPSSVCAYLDTQKKNKQNFQLFIFFPIKPKKNYACAYTNEKLCVYNHFYYFAAFVLEKKKKN